MAWCLLEKLRRKKKSLKRKNMFVCLKMKCFILIWEIKTKTKNGRTLDLAFFFLLELLNKTISKIQNILKFFWLPSLLYINYYDATVKGKWTCCFLWLLKLKNVTFYSECLVPSPGVCITNCRKFMIIQLIESTKITKW